MPWKPWGAISHLRIFPFPTWTICTSYCREHLSLTTYKCKLLLFTLTIQRFRHGGRACQRGLARTSHPSLWYLTARLSSLTSIVSSSAPRKEISATFARKRAQSSAPGEVEGAVEPTFSEEDAIMTKRLQNTLAAWRSRKRKLEYQRELEDAFHAEHKDKETWRAHALVLEALLCDKVHEVPPRMIE